MIKPDSIKGQFITATARDYDMKYEEAEAIYVQYHGTKEFYERLEEFITIRRNKIGD